MGDKLLLDCAIACNMCYRSQVVFSWENASRTTHVLQLTVQGLTTFAFAGTMDGQEWGLDIMAIPIPVYGYPKVGMVHGGFMIGAIAATREFILPTLRALGSPKFRLTGHSKGAGEAGLADGFLRQDGHAPETTILFEPPLYGGGDLAELQKTGDVRWTETHNCWGPDVITAVPIGPNWKRHAPPILLPVPDSADPAEKHKMPAIIAAIGV